MCEAPPRRSRKSISVLYYRRHSASILRRGERDFCVYLLTQRVHGVPRIFEPRRPRRSPPHFAVRREAPRGTLRFPSCVDVCELLYYFRHLVKSAFGFFPLFLAPRAKNRIRWFDTCHRHHTSKKPSVRIMPTTNTVIRATVFFAYLVLVLKSFITDVWSRVPVVELPAYSTIEWWVPAYGPAVLAGVFPFVLALCVGGALARPRVLFAAFLLSGLFVLCVLSQWSLVCVYNKGEVQNMCALGVRLMKRLETKGIHPWLTNGTLLPVLRKEAEHDYVLLTDHDLDLCFLPKDSDEVQRTLTEMQIVHWFVLDRGVWKFRIYPEGTVWYKGHSGPLMIDLEPCHPPAAGLGRRELGCNGYMWHLPNDAEAHVEMDFGPNWRTPAHTNHDFMCWMFPNW